MQYRPLGNELLQVQYTDHTTLKTRHIAYCTVLYFSTSYLFADLLLLYCLSRLSYLFCLFALFVTLWLVLHIASLCMIIFLHCSIMWLATPRISLVGQIKNLSYYLILSYLSSVYPKKKGVMLIPVIYFIEC